VPAEPQALDDGELRFVERFALLLVEGGMPRMPSRVFACILADDGGALTAGELASRLRVSPAAISGAVRYLTQTGLVVRAREPGARRDHYRVGEDPWYEVFAARTFLIRRWEDAMAEGVELIGAQRPAGRRMAETRAFFAFLRTELPALMERWHAAREG
jgi:DNA-binding transcriptional regulator GbsR (MarR family)